jgi:hypothetical protein
MSHLVTIATGATWAQSGRSAGSTGEEMEATQPLKGPWCITHRRSYYGFTKYVPPHAKLYTHTQLESSCGTKALTGEAPYVWYNLLTTRSPASTEVRCLHGLGWQGPITLATLISCLY